MDGALRTLLRIALALAAAAPLIALGAAAPLIALAAPAPARADLTSVGRFPSIPRDARVTGHVPANTLLHVTVTLEPRRPAALAAYARLVSTVGSRVYHNYLTPEQFARRFGASAAEVRAVRRALRGRGVVPGPVSAGSLSIPITATAARLEHALSVSLLTLSLPGRRTAVQASTSPSLHSGAAGSVQAVLGLDTASPPRPLLARRPYSPSLSPLSPVALSATAQTPIATGGPQPCAAARSAASSEMSHTADQIASAYGFPGLYRAGDQGAGTTVAVYELEPVDTSDVATYQSCYGIHTSIHYVHVDGGVGTGTGSGEAALDIENLVGLAPAANVIVYQGPNANSNAPGSGPYDTFSAIVNQDRAQVVSVSWGECEATLGAAAAAAENTLFAQAAVQGQTIVAASGDSGAQDCYAPGHLAQTQLAVDDPSSQPDVTGVGGTTLTSLAPRPSERVWNNGAGIAGPLPQPGAGGGGISNLWPMPGAQLGAAPTLHVLGDGATGSQCGHPGGYCREVPDVSADADPATGYLIYWNGSGTDSGLPRGWQDIGGTSAAAPLWAALMALADASRGCAHRPIGNALPALYRAAGSSFASDFNDVRSGDNDFTGTGGSRFTARAGYDEASGLGTPNAASLASDLCADALRLTDPGAQRSAAGAGVSLRLRAHDAGGAAVAFSVNGLPPGLALGRSTGRITGQPRRPGTYRVVVTVRDPAGSSARVGFIWSVGAAPRILGAFLSGLQDRRPALVFTVVAGRAAPPLRELVVSIPQDLRLVSTVGVQVSGYGATRSRVTLIPAIDALRIELREASRRIQVTLTFPALRAVAERQADALGLGPGGLELGARVLDANHGASRVRAPIETGR
jgi:Pro-kumamolisin, activation domain/Putative Ig domain